MNIQKRTMRDVFIEGIYQRMKSDETIFFLSADCGAPTLDKIRTDFNERFRSVGIAEQNLINVATGLALEGFTVVAYAIAPFLSMRACEQVRTNLSLHSAFKTFNVNMLSIGAGLSYDLSGPTHHCLEDISLIRLLPHIDLFSPSDWKLVEQSVEYCLNNHHPKYLRFDSKPLPAIYADHPQVDFAKGFTELSQGNDVCIVSTGRMTHTALKVVDILSKRESHIGVIDLFLLKSFDAKGLYTALRKYSYVITLEEAFIFRGGMDSSIVDLLLRHNNRDIRLLRLGIEDQHLFELGGREHLHQMNGLDAPSIIQRIENFLKEQGY